MERVDDPTPDTNPPHSSSTREEMQAVDSQAPLGGIHTASDTVSVYDPDHQYETLLVKLSLRYDCQDGQFFDASFPTDLQDLLPNYIYSQRIALLNQSIVNVRNLEDTSPKIRTVLLVIFLVLTTILFQFHESAHELEAWFFVIVVLGGVVIYTYHRSYEYDRAIFLHLMSFNELDCNIQLSWSQENENPSMFWFKSWRHRIQLSRDILIRFSKKPNETEFLPAYTEPGSCFVYMRERVERCPSYRTSL